ncbi:hypothetical protein KEM55_003582, partial [Ascosphaera atra]
WKHPIIVTMGPKKATAKTAKLETCLPKFTPQSTPQKGLRPRGAGGKALTPKRQAELATASTQSADNLQPQSASEQQGQEDAPDEESHEEEREESGDRQEMELDEEGAHENDRDPQGQNQHTEEPENVIPPSTTNAVTLISVPSQSLQFQSSAVDVSEDGNPVFAEEVSGLVGGQSARILVNSSKTGPGEEVVALSVDEHLMRTRQEYIDYFIHRG